MYASDSPIAPRAFVTRPKMSGAFCGPCGTGVTAVSPLSTLVQKRAIHDQITCGFELSGRSASASCGSNSPAVTRSSRSPSSCRACLYSSVRAQPEPQHERARAAVGRRLRVDHAAESVARSSTAPHSAPIPSLRSAHHRAVAVDTNGASRKKRPPATIMLSDATASAVPLSTVEARERRHHERDGRAVAQLPQKSPNRSASRAACARAARATARARPARRARRIAALWRLERQRTRSRSGTSRRRRVLELRNEFANPAG